MYKIYSTSLLLFLILFSSDMHAQDFLLGSSSDSVRDFYLVDKKIKEASGNKDYREFWVKILPGVGKESLFRKDKIVTLKKLGVSTKGYMDYSYTLQRWIIDTSAERYTLLGYVDYNNAGKALDNQSTEIYSWEVIVPGSVAESIYESIKYLDRLNKLKRMLKNTD